MKKHHNPQRRPCGAFALGNDRQAPSLRTSEPEGPSDDIIVSVWLPIGVGLEFQKRMGIPGPTQTTVT